MQTVTIKPGGYVGKGRGLTGYSSHSSWLAAK